MLYNDLAVPMHIKKYLYPHMSLRDGDEKRETYEPAVQEHLSLLVRTHWPYARAHGKKHASLAVSPHVRTRFSLNVLEASGCSAPQTSLPRGFPGLPGSRAQEPRYQGELARSKFPDHGSKEAGNHFEVPHPYSANYCSSKLALGNQCCDRSSKFR